ncbi:MAG: Ig-like domain-containing protein [Dysgonamonadaceae bacterium]|nr:Ig-like domain-containing protein [Dysgonamonadaceae bacterium]
MKQKIIIFISICIFGGCMAGCVDEMKTAGLTGISFTTDTIRINAGDRIHAIAMPIPWNASEFEFTWTSENPEIASVTSDGNVEGKSGGVTNLVASYGSIQKKLPVSVRVITLQQMLEELEVKASWHFDNPDNILEATLGDNLEEYNTSKSGSGAPCFSTDGPTTTNLAVTVPMYSYFIARHGIAANGGGSKVNEYSLMIDFKISQTGRYYTLLQTDISNQDDAEVFINGGTSIGISGGYYSPGGQVEPEMWYRWIVSVKCGTSWKEYLNGSLIHTAASDHDSKMNLDGRMALDPAGTVLFGDEDGEDNDITISAVAVWDRPLTDNEIASLGALSVDPNRSVPLLSMTLSPAGPLNMLTGRTQQLTQNLVPKNATEISFTWESSNESVVTVSPAGLITAVGQGNATVTVRNETSITASVDVSVLDPVELTDITVNTSPLTLKVWETVSYTATPVPANATDTIKWTTDDAMVATVVNGTITGVSEGTTTVSVHNVSGTIKKSIPVTVKPAYTGLEIANFTLIINSLQSLNPAPVPLDIEAQYGGISLTAGPKEGQKAIRIPKGSHFRTKHGIPANGGGSKVNEYTVLMDFKLLKDGSYCFYQTNLNNSDDVDFFLRGNMKELGIGGVYSNLPEEEKFLPDVWYRVVVTAKLGESLTYYLNGKKIFTNDSSADAAKRDSRLALDPAGVLLFADEDGEDNDLDVAGVAIWDKALSPEEVAALGGL